MSRPLLLLAAMFLGTLSLSAHLSVGPQSTTVVEKRLIAPPGPKPVGPYSPGIMAGDFLYVSGQGARDGEAEAAR